MSSTLLLLQPNYSRDSMGKEVRAQRWQQNFAILEFPEERGSWTKWGKTCLSEVGLIPRLTPRYSKQPFLQILRDPHTFMSNFVEITLCVCCFTVFLWFLFNHADLGKTFALFTEVTILVRPSAFSKWLASLTWQKSL